MAQETRFKARLQSPRPELLGSTLTASWEGTVSDGGVFSSGLSFKAIKL